ncbi:MAG: S1C family serine protease, partial [Planctomycetota bacterium]
MARLGKIGFLASLLIVGLVSLARAEESLLARLEKEVRTLAERTGPAVVKVTGAMRASFVGHDLPNFLDALLERSGTVGTGFVVSKDGLVVTTHRVARRAETARIEFSNGIVRDGQVLGSDPFFQVALVRVEPVEGIEPLTLSTAENLPDGSLGVFVGNSFGTRNISLGVVARAGRQPGVGGYDNYLVMNAPIHPGDEGGPLVGPEGEVVAMGAGRHSGAAVVTMGAGGGSVRLKGLGGSPGIGLLVPSADLRFAIHEIEEHGRVRHGKLGVHLRPGALEISEVRPDTPAEKSGLKRGDVILRVNDRKLVTDADLRFTLRRISVGKR